MKFVVVDVETANPDLKSICQIGIVVFEDGKIIDEWSTLVNPHDYFDFFNVAVHGITEKMVRKSPSIGELKAKIQEYFALGTVCSYSFFDRNAIKRNFEDLNYPWLDIMKVVRHIWSDVAKSGYGLSNIANKFNIELLSHHDALNDAKTAGYVLVEALKQSNTDLNELINRTKFPISHLKSLKASGLVIDGGNPDGKWFGEVLVFTGELGITRMEASVLASNHGFNVMKGVTKKTTILVKGTQDKIKLKGAEISERETKALELIKKGNNIVFLSEADFFDLLKDD